MRCKKEYKIMYEYAWLPVEKNLNDVIMENYISASKISNLSPNT